MLYPKTHGLPRFKAFRSYKSLKCERYRLDTFIDWPLDWLSPEHLAADGFYYLRTKDHCACIFCNGVIGGWEHGDSPREEHEKLFGGCAFVTGKPVGNIPINQGIGEDDMPPVDTLGSYAERYGPPQSWQRPLRKDQRDMAVRVKSFIKWPERVLQKPAQLAEAGFYSICRSDHVMCFHCGGGIRNWEDGDDPWVLHAQLYPDCQFVIQSKGQEYIDNVLRGKLHHVTVHTLLPPETIPNDNFMPACVTDVHTLLQLDIIQEILNMGFSLCTVLKTLQRKICCTGSPFYSVRECTEAVCKTMEEEAREVPPHSGRATDSGQISP